MFLYKVNTKKEKLENFKVAISSTVKSLSNSSKIEVSFGNQISKNDQKLIKNSSKMAPKWPPGALPEEGRKWGTSFCKIWLPVYTGARFSKPGYHGTGSALVWYALACLLCCLSCAHWRWFMSPGTFLSCATLPSFLSPEASLVRSARSPRRLELGSFEMVLKIVAEALPKNSQKDSRKEKQSTTQQAKESEKR